MNANPLLQAVGHCIYCGVGESARPLTDEHIVPYGLYGLMVLPKASCAACAAVTSRFERTCLRKMFGSLRAHLDLPTRRKKDRPNTFSVDIYSENGKRRLEAHLSEHLATLVLPVFEAPALMRGEVGTKQYTSPGAWWCDVIGDAEGRFRRLGSDVSVFGQWLDMPAFSRLLAKIAHASAIALVGQNKFEPLLPGLHIG